MKEGVSFAKKKYFISYFHKKSDTKLHIQKNLRLQERVYCIEIIKFFPTTHCSKFFVSFFVLYALTISKKFSHGFVDICNSGKNNNSNTLQKFYSIF